jgi:hypothetical protein
MSSIALRQPAHLLLGQVVGVGDLLERAVQILRRPVVDPGGPNPLLPLQRALQLVQELDVPDTETPPAVLRPDQLRVAVAVAELQLPHELVVVTEPGQDLPDQLAERLVGRLR